MKTAEVLVLCLVVGLSLAHKEHYAAHDKHEAGVRRTYDIDTMDMMRKHEQVLMQNIHNMTRIFNAHPGFPNVFFFEVKKSGVQVTPEMCLCHIHLLTT